jgi:hypothetical protein
MRLTSPLFIWSVLVCVLSSLQLTLCFCYNHWSSKIQFLDWYPLMPVSVIPGRKCSVR